MAIDARHRDKNGEIGRKHGNTLIRTLRKTYGPHFAEGCGDTEKLSDVLHKMDEPSLSTLLHDTSAGSWMRFAGRPLMAPPTGLSQPEPVTVHRGPIATNATAPLFGPLAMCSRWTKGFERQRVPEPIKQDCMYKRPWKLGFLMLPHRDLSVTSASLIEKLPGVSPELYQQMRHRPSRPHTHEHVTDMKHQMARTLPGAPTIGCRDHE